MHKIGYARASSAAQNLDRQLGALRAERCDRIVAEKVTGKSLKGRPQLEKAIDALGIGDVLVVAEWDRATRSMMDGIANIDRVLARGALVKVLDKPHLDLTTIGKGRSTSCQRSRRTSGSGSRSAPTKVGPPPRPLTDASGASRSSTSTSRPRRFGVSPVERASGPSLGPTG
jgi:Resolvase, N terminal domain